MRRSSRFGLASQQLRRVGLPFFFNSIHIRAMKSAESDISVVGKLVVAIVQRSAASRAIRHVARPILMLENPLGDQSKGLKCQEGMYR